MTKFFIGDTHFGHKNILIYEKEFRPFLSIEEHNEELIKRWNSVVTNKDEVYHLGDFCFGKKNIDIASRLNGDKILILGNHDIYPAEEYLKYFKKLYGVLLYKSFSLSHMPLLDSKRWELNIHGHIHSKKLNNIDQSKYFNVSVENINLTPISLDEINFKRYKNTEIYA